MLPLPCVQKIYLYRPAIDIRKSFDGLSRLAYTTFQIDPTLGHLFVFLNKNRTIVKLLFWDTDGYCIITKRLEQGTFSLPKESEIVISSRELQFLLEGIELKNIRQKKRYQLPQKQAILKA